MAPRSQGGWLFAGFPLAIIATFVVLPTIAGAGLSFFEWSGGDAPRFIGLENYRAALATDVQLRYAARNTVLFAVATVPITIVLAFLAAVVLNARWFVGAGLLRTIYFIPSVISIVAVGYVWRWMLDPEAGLLDLSLRSTGAAAIFGGTMPAFLGDTPWALAAIAFIHVWRQLGFSIVLYLAALARLPRSVHEAAGLDGAGPIRATLAITWPMVRPMTAFLAVTGAIWSLQVFDLVWIVTGGGEHRWTDVLNAHLYREFAANRLGYAATIGVFILALSAVVTIAQLRWLARRGVTA